MRLHYYSNHVLSAIPEEDDEVYRIDQIKEFEQVSQAYKEWLSDLLQKGIPSAVEGNARKNRHGITKIMSKMLLGIGQVRGCIPMPNSSFIDVLINVFNLPIQ